MKVLNEVKYNKEIRRHQHDVLAISEIPYASIEMLEEMFVRLDFQATQVRLFIWRRLHFSFLTK